MSMTRKLFRPGAGQKPARYIQALCTDTAAYRGDLVIWDYAATPTAITSGGVTLGALDFCFVKTEATAANKNGKAAGLIEGKAIGDRDTTTAMTASATAAAVVVVQTWGVFDSHANCVDATVAAGALLLTTSTIAGEMVDGASTDATLDGHIVGIALTADATYTRGTATDNNGVTCFVRCDY